MTTNIDDAFYLPRQKTSIFVGDIKCREYPDMPLIYGFLHKQMGIKLRKHIAKTYPDEQTHYRNYIRLYNYEEEYIETKYYLPKHKWGRINPVKSLSMSLFHRPTRHSFANQNYIDFDLKNAQLSVVLELAKKQNLKLSGGLEEYCKNPKKVRLDIAEHYQLKDKITEDGCVYSVKEQAKNLPIRIAFGGGIKKWKEEYVSQRIDNMPLITKLIDDLVIIRNHIVKVNPHIRNDLSDEGDDEWIKKSEEEKDRSVMAQFAQTWERIIQEYCVAHFVRKYKVLLGDIIPSQDGFMPLKKVIDDNKINTDELFAQFHSIVLNKFGIHMEWTVKEFDEAIHIPPSDIIPIDITVDDLLLGEARIASLIQFPLKNKLIYSNKTNLWYFTNSKTNVWCKSKNANDYLVVSTIQYYVNTILDDLYTKVRNEKDAVKKGDLEKQIKNVKKCYNSVGKSSYIGQTIKYLRTLLNNDSFPEKLDNTGGKIVFADGIYDLKLKKFIKGIRKEHYVSFTLSINYLGEDVDKVKKDKLRDILKKILNWNDKHLEYYLGILGYAFTGDAHLEKAIYYIVDGTEEGKGDNGKTFFFDVLKTLFPEYVKQSDPKLLEESNTKTHKQLPELNGARIAWLDEGTKNKLNAALMKKIGDGLKINTDIMYGNTIDLKVSYKLFVCSNHIPKIDKDEDAVYNRYRQLQLCSHFDRTGLLKTENYETLEFIADTKLGDDLKANYKNEIIDLLIEYGQKYYEKGIPTIPQEFIDAVHKTKTENNEFAKFFYENFEKKVGHNISIDEIELISCYNQEEIKKHLKKIGLQYNRNLKEFDVKIKTQYQWNDITKQNDKIDKKIIGGVEGFIRISRNQDVNDKEVGDEEVGDEEVGDEEGDEEVKE